MRTSPVIKALKSFVGKSRVAITATSDKLSVIGLEVNFELQLRHNDIVGEWSSFAEFELAMSNNLDNAQCIGDVNPTLLEYQTVVDAKRLASVLKWCAIATDNECTRYVLQGINVSAKGFTATDGSRLHHSPCNNFATALASNDNTNNIPMQTVKLLLAILGADPQTKDIVVEFTANNVIFRGRNWLLCTRMTEGRFPSWEQTIPSGDFDTFEIDAKMIEAMKSSIVKTKLENEISKDACIDKTARKKWLPKAATISIGTALLDCEYVLDGMAKGTNKIQVYGRKNPVKIEHELGFAVIMIMGMDG